MVVYLPLFGPRRFHLFLFFTSFHPLGSGSHRLFLTTLVYSRSTDTNDRHGGT